jgi:predicted Zn-dependent peptidase
MNPALVSISLTVAAAILGTRPLVLIDAALEPPMTGGVRTVCAALTGTDRIAFHCLLPAGYADEQEIAATATILAAALRADVRETAADSPVTTHVTARHTWLGAVVESEDFPATLERLGRWLSGELQLDDAALERARDVAVLMMDDHAMVLPGPILRDRARRALLGHGSSVDGRTIEQASRWPAAEVRRRLREVLRREGSMIAFLGGDDAEALRTQVDAAFAALPPREGGAAIAAAAAPRAGELAAMEEIEHDRVAAPFVTMALRVPSADPSAAAGFRVAFELLRKRLVTELGQPRGGEARAQFPAFHHDPFDGELAFVGRRGENSDSAGTTRVEIETAFDRVLSVPAGPAELAVIRSQLLAAAAVPPLETKLQEIAQRMPSVQIERARLLLADAMSGYPTSLLEHVAEIDADAVARAMSEHFGPAARTFFALVPRKVASPTRR